MKKGGIDVITIISAIIGFIIDLLTKNQIKKQIGIGEEKEILKGHITLKHSKNRGFMLGAFKDKPYLVRAVNVLATIVAVGIILPLSKTMNLVGKIGVGLLMGGAFGNLYDRLKFGEVTDFFSFKKLPKVIFNLADMFIFMGSIITLISELFREVK